jgi:hypothetical protein
VLTIQQAQQQIKDMLQDISIEHVRDLKTTMTATEHVIRLRENVIPKPEKMKSLPHHYEQEFDKLIDDLLASKRIQPSNSPWAAPVQLVKKPDGSLRVTINYKRQLNRHIIPDAYPMKFITDLFARLGKAKYYTVLDCTSAYWQIPLHPDSRQYTAFQCKRGLFEWLVMPMGILNGSKELQRGMEKALSETDDDNQRLLGWICDIYQDDIIVYSDTLEEHPKHVAMVRRRFIKFLIWIKLSKAKICQTQVDYLSHTISNGNIQPSKRKVSALFNPQVPTTVRQVHALYGLGAY